MDEKDDDDDEEKEEGEEVFSCIADRQGQLGGEPGQCANACHQFCDDAAAETDATTAGILFSVSV